MDNTPQNGTANIATDGIVTLNGATVPEVQAQVVKPAFGGDGVAQYVTLNNGLPVNQVNNSLVSTINSSAVNLAANAVFTGVAEDVTDYVDIGISAFSDQASATDGLSIQQSSNGTNWDITDNYSIPASTGKNFSVAARLKFFRMVYTNGPVAQTAFRLQAKLNKTYTKSSSVRPQDARTNDNDFEENLAFLMGFNGTTWDRLRSTIANGLAVDVTRLSALVAGTASIGTVQPPAITKGTQGAVGFTTQDLIDAGRARVSITFMAVAPAVADTLLSLVKVTNGTAAAGATSIGVTAGKTLRITSITFSIKANAAAAAFATLTLRQNPAGATVIGSTPETRIDVGNTAATIGAADKVEAIFPDGMEFSGTQTLGISLAAQAITNIISISINGFEY